MQYFKGYIYLKKVMIRGFHINFQKNPNFNNSLNNIEIRGKTQYLKILPHEISLYHIRNIYPMDPLVKIIDDQQYI